MSDLSSFKVFESLAASFSLLAPLDHPKWESILISNGLEEITGHESTETKKHPEIRLWYDQAITPGINALERKIGSWLESLGMVATEKVVKMTISVLTLTLRDDQGLVQALEHLESSLRTSDVSHFAILNINLPSSWNTSLDWRGFQLGPLDIEKVKSRCKRAGESIIDGFAAKLKGNPSIVSPVYECAVFDLKYFFEISTVGLNEDLAQLVHQEWFRSIQQEHWDQMWADFEDRRALLCALGYGLVQGDTFRNNLKQIRISCYLRLRDNARNEGCVVFGVPKQYITLPDLLETKNAIHQIHSICPFSAVEKSSLNQVINAYSMSLSRGVKIAFEGHMSESYLHFIIALEQLFSSRENTSQTVAGRTAVLVHRQLGVTLTDCRKSLLKEHYEARSRFVHSSVPIPRNLIAPIHEITQAVLRSLLWLAKGEESRSPNFFDIWVKRLDWIIAGYEAGIQPPDDVLDANGIITSDALPLP